MSLPVYGYLTDLVEAHDYKGAPSQPHIDIVNGVLRFIRDDLQYVVKFGDKRVIEEIVEYLRDMI